MPTRGEFLGSIAGDVRVGLKTVQFPHFMVYLSMSPLLSTLKYDKVFDIARPMSVLLVALFWSSP